LGKYVAKFRPDRDMDDWDSGKSNYDSKKRKKNHSEERKQKMRQYEEETYGYEDMRQKYRFKL
jgi:hypothetical protein